MNQKTIFSLILLILFSTQSQGLPPALIKLLTPQKGQPAYGHTDVNPTKQYENNGMN